MLTYLIARCKSGLRLNDGTITILNLLVTWAVGDRHPSRAVLGQAYRGLTGGFLLLRIFSVGISVSPHVCFILGLILISMFLR